MTLPEFRTRLILGLNMHAPTLKLERGWCVVNNWTLFMHVMKRDGNDETVNIYRKQKAHGNSVYHSPNKANPEHMAN